MSESIKYDNMFHLNYIIMLIGGKNVVSVMSVIDKTLKYLLFGNSLRNVNDHNSLSVLSVLHCEQFRALVFRWLRWNGAIVHAEVQFDIFISFKLVLT